MSYVFKSIVIGFIGIILTACNTMNGVGEDISAGGRALQRAAYKPKATTAYSRRPVVQEVEVMRPEPSQVPRSSVSARPN